MYSEFNTLSGNAKIWIYDAGRSLNRGEQETVGKAARQFCMQWNAHGSPLKSSFQLLNDRFLILAVDESTNAASGCSIDESVYFIRELSEILQLDFLDRSRVAFKDPATGEIFSMTINEAKDKAARGEISGNMLLFNHFVLNKKALESTWTLPVKESWLKNHLDKKISL